VNRDVERGVLPKELADETVRMNIEVITKQQSEPHVAHERYRVSGNMIRQDSVSSLDGVEVRPETEYRHTRVMTGDHRRGQRRSHALDHALKSGVFNPKQLGRIITSPWERIVGLHMRVRRVIVMATADFSPLPPGMPPTTNEELRPDPKRVEEFAAGTGSARWFVDRVGAHGGERLVYQFVDAGRVVARIVLDPDNPWHIYEQRITGDDGSVSLLSLSEAYDNKYVPREKVITEIKDGVGEINRKIVVLNSEVPTSLPKAIFEFDPPDDYVIQEIGPDGFGIVEETDSGQPGLNLKLGTRWPLILLNGVVIIALIVAWAASRGKRRAAG
jgi:hypothetical protein